MTAAPPTARACEGARDEGAGADASATPGAPLSRCRPVTCVSPRPPPRRLPEARAIPPDVAESFDRLDAMFAKLIEEVRARARATGSGKGGGTIARARASGEREGGRERLRTAAQRVAGSSDANARPRGPADGGAHRRFDLSPRPPLTPRPHLRSASQRDDAARPRDPPGMVGPAASDRLEETIVGAAGISPESSARPQEARAKGEELAGFPPAEAGGGTSTPRASGSPAVGSLETPVVADLPRRAASLPNTR